MQAYFPCLYGIMANGVQYVVQFTYQEIIIIYQFVLIYAVPDYRIFNSLLIITRGTPGGVFFCFDILIFDDGVLENNEYFLVVLESSSPEFVSVADGVQNVTIIDNEGK